MQEVKAPIIGINRHRLTTDGEGVTTLVAFHGCPLHCKYCLNPQTSLNVPLKQLEMVAPLVKEFVVDVKDMDEQTYKAYTTQGNVLVASNLKWIAENGYADKTLVRLPLIPYYNTEAAQEESRKQIESMGFRRFDKFEYIVR